MAPGPAPAPGDTGAPGDTSETALPTDTGPARDFLGFEDCDPAPDLGLTVAPSAVWHDPNPRNRAGRGLWVGDLDGDGRPEALVGAPGTPTYDTRAARDRVKAAVYRVPADAPSGPLDAVAVQVVGAATDDESWGDSVLGFPASGRFAATRYGFASRGAEVLFFEAGLGSSGRGAPAGALQLTDETPRRLWACPGLAGTESYCLGNRDVVVFDAPPVGRVVDGARLWTTAGGALSSTVLASPHGPALVVGQQWEGALEQGRVDLVDGQRTGEVTSLADVSSASWVGPEVGQFLLGWHVSTGALDADEHPDLVVGALGGQDALGVVFGFLGPFIGEQQVSGAEFAVFDAKGGVTGDLNGDTVPDLVVTGAGGLGVFLGPLCGRYLFTEADLLLVAGSTSPGLDIPFVADVDGDGVDDLVAAAPRDTRGGPDAGAVYVFAGLAAALAEAR